MLTDKGIKPFENEVWLSSPTMHGDELRYMTEAFDTNRTSTVAEKVGCKHAVDLSSGTAALHLCMKLAGVKPGSHVFCFDMTSMTIPC